jgi:hypothetical protein
MRNRQTATADVLKVMDRSPSSSPGLVPGLFLRSARHWAVQAIEEIWNAGSFGPMHALSKPQFHRRDC